MADTQMQKTQQHPIETGLREVSRKYSSMRTNDKLKFAQEISFLMEHIRRNTDLQKCTIASLQQALLQAAAIGLSFNPVLQHIYLIPRRERKKENNESWDAYNAQVKTIAYLTPSYRGMLAKAEQSKTIQFFHADVVYQRDAFRYRGSDEEPLHEYDVMKPRGNIVGAYAYIQLLNGKYKVEWVSVEQIEKARARSEFPNSLMWKEFYPEACKKVAIRRAWKTWPTGLQEVFLPMIENMNIYEGIVNDQGEAEVVITDEQRTELHAMLTDQGLSPSDADRWLHRVAQTEGLAKIEDLPISRFDEAKLMLDSKLDTLPKE